MTPISQRSRIDDRGIFLTNNGVLLGELFKVLAPAGDDLIVDNVFNDNTSPAADGLACLIIKRLQIGKLDLRYDLQTVTKKSAFCFRNRHC